MNLRRKLKHGWMLLILLAAFQVKAQDQQGPLNFSLEQSIEYALQNNTDVKNAHLDKKIAKAKVGETRAIGLPQINGSVNLNYNLANPQNEAFGGDDEGSAFPEPQNAMDSLILYWVGATSPFSNPQVQEIFSSPMNTQATLSMNQLIFDGSYFVGLQAAKTYKELSTKSLKRTEIDTKEAVTKAYYAVLVNRERFKLIDVNFGRLDSLYKDTKVMYENGFVEKIDVDRLKVQVNNLKVQKQQFTRMLLASEYLLKFQMGMPIYQQIKLTDSIDNILVEESLPDTDDFNYTQRIEYSLLQTNHQLNRLNLKNLKVQYLPNLSAYANFGYTSFTREFGNLFSSRYDTETAQDLQTWNKSASVGFRLNLPIFDGLMKSYKIQQSKLEIRKVENQKNQLENAIDMEIYNSRIKLRNGMENLDIQRENLDLAQDVFNVTKIKYQEGVGSNLEVLEAESSFQEAQTNYYNALYEALIAKVELEKATGTLDKN